LQIISARENFWQKVSGKKFLTEFLPDIFAREFFLGRLCQIDFSSICQRVSAREFQLESFSQRVSAREFLPKSFCQRVSAKEFLPESFCQRVSARDFLPKSFC
jgi:hypothetical protein